MFASIETHYRNSDYGYHRQVKWERARLEDRWQNAEDVIQDTYLKALERTVAVAKGEAKPIVDIQRWFPSARKSAHCDRLQKEISKNIVNYNHKKDHLSYKSFNEKQDSSPVPKKIALDVFITAISDGNRWYDTREPNLYSYRKPLTFAEVRAMSIYIRHNGITQLAVVLTTSQADIGAPEIPEEDRVDPRTIEDERDYDWLVCVQIFILKAPERRRVILSLVLVYGRKPVDVSEVTPESAANIRQIVSRFLKGD